MGVSKNRGKHPKWMVKIMENPIKHGIHLGGFTTPIFGGPPILPGSHLFSLGPTCHVCDENFNCWNPEKPGGKISGDFHFSTSKFYQGEAVNSEAAAFTTKKSEALVADSR